MMKIAPLLLACVAIAGNAYAADDMKKADGMMKKESAMTMQECKDHMAMAKKDGMKKDDAMMKKETACNDMMKKGDTAMKGDANSMKSGDAMAPKK